MEGTGLGKTVYCDILGDAMHENVKQLGPSAELIGSTMAFLKVEINLKKKKLKYFQFNFGYI